MDVNSGIVVGSLLGLLIAAVAGLVIGALAKLALPGRDPGGWAVTMLVGIAGSWVGAFLFAAFDLGRTVPGLIGAVLGAMLLLAGYRLLVRA